METLHGLVNKGVKVDLGIPYDMWDEPSAEVTIMKSQVTLLLGSLRITVYGYIKNIYFEIRLHNSAFILSLIYFSTV